MLNRLAKAAEDAAEIENTDPYGCCWEVTNWHEVVRAVLREMREPSDGAINGAIEVMATLENPPDDAPVVAKLSFVRALAVSINAGLIDSILQEKPDAKAE